MNIRGGKRTPCHVSAWQIGPVLRRISLWLFRDEIADEGRIAPSARAPASKEAHYESEAHSSAPRRPAHRPESERNSEKEQTPPSCLANGETDVEALLARLRAL
ncbi:hypothetical protein C0J45_9008 [Silurus meridionalis]|nr:hypothetical protein C0J45_9008 [Silurus meridionalis]